MPVRRRRLSGRMAAQWTRPVWASGGVTGWLVLASQT
jgi:hypothetical protein